MRRRDACRAIAGALGILAFPGRARAADRMPTAFVGHGGPQIVIDAARKAELSVWGAALPRPRGIVVLTPHYRARGHQIGHVGKGHAQYDFPARFRAGIPDLEYATPPNDALAGRTKALLGDVSFARDRPGFDHTSWMPLILMFPGADIPVVEVAMPFALEPELFALGRSLAPLRDEGVLILASGSLTHNLASADLSGSTSVPPWAAQFDEWVKKTLLARDVASLLDWRSAPSATLSHPDDGGHYRVMLVALGAAVGSGSSFSSARFPAEGFELGSVSKRCIELV
jgi:4,5-DOPA dioxygenase extradiol